MLTAQIDRIDRDFLFGNDAATSLGFARKCSPLHLHLGTTQVIRGLALLYITSTNINLGFDTTPVSSSAVLDTLIPRGEGTKTPIVGCTGRWFITPFRRVIHSHIERHTTTFDANWRWFFHLPLPGEFGQKSQLFRNLVTLFRYVFRMD